MAEESFLRPLHVFACGAAPPNLGLEGLELVENCGESGRLVGGGELAHEIRRGRVGPGFRGPMHRAERVEPPNRGGLITKPLLDGLPRQAVGIPVCGDRLRANAVGEAAGQIIRGQRQESLLLVDPCSFDLRHEFWALPGR